MGIGVEYQLPWSLLSWETRQRSPKPRLDIYIHICILYTFIDMHIAKHCNTSTCYIYIYIVYIFGYVHIHIYIYIYVYKYTYIYTYISIYEYIFIYLYEYIYIYIYTYFGQTSRGLILGWILFFLQNDFFSRAKSSPKFGKSLVLSPTNPPPPPRVSKKKQ